MHIQLSGPYVPSFVSLVHNKQKLDFCVKTGKWLICRSEPGVEFWTGQDRIRLFLCSSDSCLQDKASCILSKNPLFWNITLKSKLNVLFWYRLTLLDSSPWSHVNWDSTHLYQSRDGDADKGCVINKNKALKVEMHTDLTAGVSTHSQTDRKNLQFYVFETQNTEMLSN